MIISLEGGNYAGVFFIVIAIMIAPPFILSLIGFAIRKSYPDAAKVLYILAGLYLIIGLGLCGSMMV